MISLNEENMEVSEEFNLYNEGQKIAIHRDNILNKDIIDYNDFKWGTLFFNDYKVKEGLDDKTESNWINNAYDFFMEEFRTKSIEEIEEYFKDSKISATFKSVFAFNFNKWMKTASPQIREGIVSWTKPQSIEYEYLSPAFWCQWMGDGNTGVMKGEKGSGKTDFIWNIADNFIKWEEYADVDGVSVKREHRVAGNMAVEEKLPWYDYYTSYSELMLILCDNVINGCHTLQIGDEMTVGGMRKKKAMSGTSMNLEEHERLTRKFNTDTLYVWHYDEEIPTEIYPILTFNGKKYGNNKEKYLRKSGLFQFRHGKRTNVYNVKNIPRTNIKFKTKDVAPFNMDIKISDIISNMNNLEHEQMNDVEMFLAIKKIIMELREEKKEKEEKKR
jgi:hypothetical protein